MSKPYDASVKDLIAAYPADWVALTGKPATGIVEVVDADVSTVTAAADKVLKVNDPVPWLLHLELQSSPRSDLAEQLQWNNTFLRHRHGLRVRTVVVLLRRAADSPQWNGVYRDQFSGGAALPGVPLPGLAPLATTGGDFSDGWSGHPAAGITRRCTGV